MIPKAADFTTDRNNNCACSNVGFSTSNTAYEMSNKEWIMKKLTNKAITYSVGLSQTLTNTKCQC